ncbi:MAG: delta-60 repeat domain-containing protein, partial [Flavitalea sp.]
MKQAPTLLTDQRTVVRLILSCILFFTTFGLYAQSILPRLPVTNGPVAAIAHSGNMLYIGGNFTHVGPNIAYGIPIHKALSVPDLRFAMPNGDVYCALPDGEGGWYIGGTFSAVGGEERNMLARINADGSLHPWNPGVNGFYVNSMQIANGKLFISGSF